MEHLATYKLQTKLSDKPSELIRQALDDLKKVERTKGLKVNMMSYLSLNGEEYKHGACELCLAGSMMYVGTPEIKKLIGDGTYRYITPQNFCGTVPKKLEFLSLLQFGYFKRAFAYLQTPKPDFLPDNDPAFPNYSVSRPAYKRALRRIANELELLGL